MVGMNGFGANAPASVLYEKSGLTADAVAVAAQRCCIHRKEKQHDTVNTVPPVTLDAFLDHGHVAATLEGGLVEAQAHLARLAELGIDLNAIAAKLLDDGVAAFVKSFETLMASIAARRETLLAGRQARTVELGAHQPAAQALMAAHTAP